MSNYCVTNSGKSFINQQRLGVEIAINFSSLKSGMTSVINSITSPNNISVAGGVKVCDIKFYGLSYVYYAAKNYQGVIDSTTKSLKYENLLYVCYTLYQLSKNF